MLVDICYLSMVLSDVRGYCENSTRYEVHGNRKMFTYTFAFIPLVSSPRLSKPSIELAVGTKTMF